MEFLYLFLYRSMSGLQNGLGYAGKRRGRRAVSCLLALAAFLPSLCLLPSKPAAIVLLATLGGSVISALGAIGVEDSFDTRMRLLPTDVHLWEMLATGGVMISVTAIGGNLLLILASVYPALIIHKGLINTFSGLPWWDVRTDDATGKTFSIPLLNLRIPRMGLRGRQVVAVLSLIVAGIAWLIPIDYSIYNIFFLFF